MEEVRLPELNQETGSPEIDDDKWECFVCREVFSVKGSLTRHLKTHRAERPHKCQFCGSCFRRPDHLYQHHKAMHPTELLNFECDECHEVFNTKGKLRLHKTEHVGAHQCEFCGRIFTRKQFLTVHKKTHTGDKPYSCEYCSKSFTAKYFLQEHRKRHTEETPFKCEICKIYFQKESCLRGHHTRQHVIVDDVSSSKRRKKLKLHDIPTEIVDMTCLNHEKALDPEQDPVEKHKDAVFQCDTCNQFFDSETMLVEHNQLHAGQGPPHTCDLCGEDFYDMQNLRLHKQVHSEQVMSDMRVKQEEINEECHTSLDNSIKLEEHLSSHKYNEMYQWNSEETSWMCDSCGMIFVSERSIQEHECKGHSLSNGISVENVPGSVVVLQGNKITENTDYRCETCGATFIEKSLLSTHLISHMSKETAPGYPDLVIHAGNSSNMQQSADVVFINNDTSLVNVVTITDRKYYECDFCHKQFTTNSYLNVHKRAHNGIKPYTCEFCGKHFTAKCNLKVHIRLHTGEKPYTCEVCGKRFSDMSARNSHRRSHFSEKPFSCDLCERTFSQKQSFILHRRSHSEENSLKCLSCDKCFTALTINVHKQEHSGSEAYQCQMCLKILDANHNLQLHLKNHEKNPYICEICGEIFDKKYEWSEHVSTHT